jgi:hypothetical protein
VALKDKEWLLPSKGTADLGRKLGVVQLTGHFPALRFSSDFKGRKLLVICSSMQKEETRR